jgi:hypothetical protein
MSRRRRKRSQQPGDSRVESDKKIAFIVILITCLVVGAYGSYRVVRHLRASVANRERRAAEEKNHEAIERLVIIPASSNTVTIANPTERSWPSSPAYVNEVYSNNFPPLPPGGRVQLQLKAFRKGAAAFDGSMSNVTEITVAPGGFIPVTRSFSQPTPK